MINWKNIVVSPETTLLETIARIDKAGLQIALVLDGQGLLAGILSDGDVRRAILRGLNLESPTASCMNSKPVTAAASASQSELLGLMRRKMLRHVPLLNEQQQVVGLATLDALVGGIERPNPVVLMAGGLGSRLMPLTKNTPKPLLRVGDKPILESILESFYEHGFRKFYFSVNYLAQSFKDHFGDGGKWGVEISYLHENKRLGTAGALSLLPSLPEVPLLVMNGDLLTRARFDSILDFHIEHDSLATMAVREYDLEVPYGVVRLDGHHIVALEEKPIQRFFVNAGIYVLSPEALESIPKDTFFDMPTLFQKLKEENRSTSAYPLREYWLDIGRMEEFERAQHEWCAMESRK